jgi:hypothetical protein
MIDRPCNFVYHKLHFQFSVSFCLQFRRSIHQFRPNSANRIRLSLNSKRPDGDSVKQASPPSKFLEIYTTIQGHDLSAIPINKTVGAPSLSPNLSPSSLYQSKLSSSSTSTPQNLMAGSSSRHRARDEAEGSRAGARRRQ